MHLTNKNIICEEHFGFVPRRLITDNIICDFECLHFMKRSRAKKDSICALKLDTRKAYDQSNYGDGKINLFLGSS
jgi:hypothetical protein